MSEHVADEELLGLIDAEISTARAVEIEHHLEQCPECLTRHRLLHTASTEAVNLCTGPARPATGVAAARARLSEMIEADIERRWRRRAPIALALTAAVLFFVVRHESTLVHRSLIVERGALPVAAFTPGLARVVSTEELCGSASRPMPRISSALQMQVLRDYGMEHVSPAEYELDYLITPELGGLADRRNLWPEPYGLRSWNAHAKDVLENRLPQLVCSGEIDIATAQREIASNWIDAYRKYLTSEPAIQLHARVLEFPQVH